MQSFVERLTIPRNPLVRMDANRTQIYTFQL